MGRDQVMLDTSKDLIKDLDESGEMGRNPIHIEQNPIKNYKEVEWTYLRGVLVSFMQCIKRYDKAVSM